MHHAAYWGQPRAVQQLLRLGADSTKLDQSGKLAAEVAEERSQVSIVQMLVNAENLNDDTMKPKPRGDTNEATTTSEPTHSSEEVIENREVEVNEPEEQVRWKLVAYFFQVQERVLV